MAHDHDHGRSGDHHSHDHADHAGHEDYDDEDHEAEDEVGLKEAFGLPDELPPLRLPPDAPVLGMDDPWRYRIRGEFEAVPGAEGWRFGFHRLRSHQVLPIATCDIHDLRIEQALPESATAGPARPP